MDRFHCTYVVHLHVLCVKLKGLIVYVHAVQVCMMTECLKCSEYSLICHSLFSKNMVDQRIWVIN